jgi:thiol-disulfide isomerase/thioredoxin
MQLKKSIYFVFKIGKMKNALLIMALILICFGSCKTTKPASSVNSEKPLPPPPLPDLEPNPVNFSDPSTWVLGYFKPERLKQIPHDSWFVKEYDDYQINSEALNKLLDLNKDNITIKIIMGTWCPDSRREVPRLMRILDIWRFPETATTFIGVDKNKSSEVKGYGSLKIEKIPTIILYKNNIEAGRIIEIPVTSLEQDIVNILFRE